MFRDIYIYMYCIAGCEGVPYVFQSLMHIIIECLNKAYLTIMFVNINIININMSILFECRPYI